VSQIATLVGQRIDPFKLLRQGTETVISGHCLEQLLPVPVTLHSKCTGILSTHDHYERTLRSISSVLKSPQLKDYRQAVL
jgi:hypothetical protein